MRVYVCMFFFYVLVRVQSVEGCYNTTGANIATGYRNNKGMLQRQQVLKIGSFAATVGFIAKGMTVQCFFFSQ